MLTEASPGTDMLNLKSEMLMCQFNGNTWISGDMHKLTFTGPFYSLDSEARETYSTKNMLRNFRCSVYFGCVCCWYSLEFILTDIDIGSYELSQLIFWFPIDIYLRYLWVINKKNMQKAHGHYQPLYSLGQLLTPKMYKLLSPCLSLSYVCDKILIR